MYQVSCFYHKMHDSSQNCYIPAPLQGSHEKKSRLFGAQAKELQLNIKTFPDNVSPYQFISRLFDQLVEDTKERCQMESNDKM